MIPTGGNSLFFCLMLEGWVLPKVLTKAPFVLAKGGQAERQGKGRGPPILSDVRDKHLLALDAGQLYNDLHPD